MKRGGGIGEGGLALSSRRDKRQHAVWETAWKSASVNTPRPHVLPGQRGWPLSRHICTQSLSFQPASQGDRAGVREEGGGGGREGEEFPDRENLLLLWQWRERWHVRETMNSKAARRGREIAAAYAPYAKFIKILCMESRPPSLQLYICIIPLGSCAKVCLASIITQPARILDRRWIAV